VLSRAFSNADLALVARGITSACDAADGATDDMVLRPDACRFDPNTRLCRGEKDANCLTATQVSALQRAFGGPRTSSGRALYVGQAWDPGIAAPGWRQWKLGSSQTATPNAANTTLMAGALAYEFVTPADPSLAIARFDFDRDPGRMQAFSQVYDATRDATLAAFRKRGGKLLIFHGTADPIFSALESFDYYQRLSRNNGGRAATAQWGSIVSGARHEPLRRRPRDRQLRRPRRHCRLGRETHRADAHRRIGQSARGELRRPHASALRVSRVRSLLAVLGLRQRGARGANGTRGAAVGPGLAAGTGTGGRGRGAAAPAQPPVVLSRNGKEYTVTATNVRAGTEIKVATERPSVSLTLTELDRGSWVIFELPGFTTAASGTPQDSLNALRKTSETSYFKDKDALWVKVVSKGDPGNGAPGGGTSLEVSR
jgi:hypothetical protein